MRRQFEMAKCQGPAALDFMRDGLDRGDMLIVEMLYFREAGGGEGNRDKTQNADKRPAVVLPVVRVFGMRGKGSAVRSWSFGRAEVEKIWAGVKGLRYWQGLPSSALGVHNVGSHYRLCGSESYQVGRRRLEKEESKAVCNPRYQANFQPEHHHISPWSAFRCGGPG